MNGPSSQPVTASNSSSTRNGNGNGNGNGSGINSSSNSDALSPGLPSSRVDTIDVHGARILCVADIRGKISQLNDLAAEHKAQAIIHTGDFGFYDDESVERMADKTLRHVLQYTKLIDTATREKHYPGSPSSPNYPSLGQLRDKLANPSPELVAEQNGNAFILSEFPKLRSGEIKLEIPVYTVAGACEDIAILEKLRLAPPSPITTRSSGSAAASATTLPQTNEYSIPNLTVLSEGVTRVLHIGGVKLRLFGLGGSVVPHKLFDNGEGNATMAGGSGTIWTTALQVGELVDTAARVFDQSETRLLVTHAAPGREGLIAQVALALKCDFTVSASLHFRYGTSYNDFSVRADTDSYRTKFVQSSRAFAEVHDAVKTQVESVIDEHQKKLLQNALNVSRRVPDEKAEEPAWKNSWNWNLTDAAFGTLVLDIKDGRIASEMKSSGFNFAYRLKINDKSSSPAQSQNQSSSNPGSQQQQQSRNNRLPFAPKHLQSGFQGHRAQGQGNHSQSPNSAAASPTAQSEPRSQSPSQPTQPQSQQGQGQGQDQSQSQGQERSQSPATSTPTTTALQGQKGAAPSPNAFASMTDSFFRGGRGGRGAHLGPRIGHSAAPGAGRGRGSADLGQYVSQQSRHTPNSSGGGNNGNASGNVNNGARGKQEDAMASTGDAPASSQKKEEGQGQNRNEGTAQSAQSKPETPAPAAPSDSKDIPVSVAPSGPAGETGNAAGNSSNGQQQQQQQQQQQKRPSNLQKRGDSSADWRAQDRSQDPASSEGEGGYSSSRGGRGGRGRGRGGEGRGGFQEGRGGHRGGRGGRGGAGGRGGRSFSGVQGEGGNSSAGEAGPANSGANDNSNSNANANAKPAASPAPAASSATTPAPSS